MMRRAAVAVTGVVLGALLVFGAAGAASAHYDPNPPTPVPQDGDPGPAAQVSIVSVRNGSIVNGALGTAPVNPTAYPAAPTTGQDEYAAIIGVRDALNPAAPTTDAYCVNLRTSTTIGIEYSAADWGINVDNSSYIIYILQNYYPLTNLPAAATTEDQVAAVQSAIWYFSDGFVLTNTRPDVRTLTEGIVADAIQNGSNVTPPPAPTLTITPTTSQAPSDTRNDGPFQIGGTATGITIEREDGLQLYGDAARTQPFPTGVPVVSGQSVWAGQVQDPSGSFTLRADYQESVGTLYLADAGANAYQKIVLAQNFTLPVRAVATSTVYAANSATLRKTITGSAAGRQGAVTVQLVCDQPPPAGTPTTLTVPAGAAAGNYELVVTSIPVGATCHTEETADGHTVQTALASTTVTPQTITIPQTGPSVITVTNTYVPATPILPVTGSPDLTAAALTGFGLVAVGVTTLIARHRRRTT